MINWVSENKEWLFSGIGGAVILWALSHIPRWIKLLKADSRSPFNRITAEGNNNPTPSFPTPSLPTPPLPTPSLVEKACSSCTEFSRIYNKLTARFLEQSELLKAMKGIPVNWSGYVLSVNEHDSGTVSLMVVDNKDFTNRPIFCAGFVFNNEWMTRLFALRKNDQVNICGKYFGSVRPFMFDGQSMEMVEPNEE